MRCTRVLLALVLLTILGGCAASSAAEPPAISVSGPLTDVELDRLFDAEQLLTRDCARQAGFEYWPLVRRPVPEQRSFPYGVDDVAWAKRYGYGIELEAKSRKLAANHPNQQYLDKLTPERRKQFAAVLNGPAPVGLEARDAEGRRVTHSDKGCDAEAQRKLYGDLPAWYRATKVTNGLPRVRADQILSDRSFAPLVSKWSGCMKTAGFDFRAPVQSADLMRRRTDGPAAEEIRTAVSEAECLQSSGLAAAAKAADQRIAAEQQRQFKSELDTEQRLRRAALPVAAEVISRG
jgi:hypothetical protein